MEKKEENYIRQLLSELDDYLFSLKWYDKEDNEIMLKNIIGFDSIFQIIPKRFHKLLEGKIYTQEELDKAREEGRREYFSMGMEYFSLIEDSNIYQQKGWKLPEEKAKRLQILDKIFNLTLKTKEDGL